MKLTKLLSVLMLTTLFTFSCEKNENIVEEDIAGFDVQQIDIRVETNSGVVTRYVQKKNLTAITPPIQADCVGCGMDCILSEDCRSCTCPWADGNFYEPAENVKIVREFYQNGNKVNEPTKRSSCPWDPDFGICEYRSFVSGQSTFNTREFWDGSVVNCGPVIQEHIPMLAYPTGGYTFNQLELMIAHPAGGGGNKRQCTVDGVKYIYFNVDRRQGDPVIFGDVSYRKNCIRLDGDWLSVSSYNGNTWIYVANPEHVGQISNEKLILISYNGKLH